MAQAENVTVGQDAGDAPARRADALGLHIVICAVGLYGRPCARAGTVQLLHQRVQTGERNVRIGREQDLVPAQKQQKTVFGDGGAAHQLLYPAGVDIRAEDCQRLLYAARIVYHLYGGKARLPGFGRFPKVGRGTPQPSAALRGGLIPAALLYPADLDDICPGVGVGVIVSDIKPDAVHTGQHTQVLEGGGKLVGILQTADICKVARIVGGHRID